MIARWCEQCQQVGHSKWLFLGTHKTHRMYIRYIMWQRLRMLNKKGEDK